MPRGESQPIPEEEVSTVKEQPERGQNVYEARDLAVEQYEVQLVPEVFCRDERNFWQQEAKSIKENAEKELEEVRDWAVANLSYEERKVQRLKQLEEERDSKLKLPNQAIKAIGIIEAELRKGKADTAKKYVDRMLSDAQRELKRALDSFERYQKTFEGKYYLSLRQQQSADKEFARTIPDQSIRDLIHRKIDTAEELLGTMKEGKNLESRATQYKARLNLLETSKKLLDKNKVLTDKEIEELSK